MPMYVSPNFRGGRPNCIEVLTYYSSSRHDLASVFQQGPSKGSVHHGVVHWYTCETCGLCLVPRTPPWWWAGGYGRKKGYCLARSPMLCDDLDQGSRPIDGESVFVCSAKGHADAFFAVSWKASIFRLSFGIVDGWLQCWRGGFEGGHLCILERGGVPAPSLAVFPQWLALVVRRHSPPSP